jgi:aminoglycoside phosphotransferase (APT) family kinase protein
MNHPRPALDTASLELCLKNGIPGLHGPLVVDDIPGGQSNPTFFVSTPTHRLVLRKKPAGPVLPSAHAVEREYRILRALANTGVPVPTTRLLCEDASVIGTPFYVMDRLDGRVFNDPALPGVLPGERRAMYLAVSETLAALHRVDWQACGLSDFGRPGGYFARQISRWSKQWALSEPVPNPDIDFLIEWLSTNIPKENPTTIVHGDFRIGNLMFHPTEPRVIGVLDWELATLGDPMADVAYSALGWRLGVTEYMGIRDLDLAALGIPSQAEYLAHYAAHAAWPSACVPFHFAFSLFRLAVIFEGIAARARQGNASSGNAAEVGALSSILAQRAREALDSH